MAYDKGLARRVRDAFALRQAQGERRVGPEGERRGDAGLDGVVERKMFGGLAFMLDGNMAAGILGDRLMVRVGAEAYEEALSEPHCGPMDFTGRPMRGFVVVEPEGSLPRTV